MRATDQMLTQYVAEIEEKQQLIDSLVETAQKEGRDLEPKELELATRARDRIKVCNENMIPLEESRRISGESALRIAQIADFMSKTDGQEPKPVEYRSAGAYVLDVWKAGLGGEESIRRLDTFNRAAAHQTTADNPGLLPEQILGPVINFVDESRPLTTALGPRNLPSGTWSRPRITQHTNVAAQGGEKTELVSRKLTIAKIPVNAVTYGGYVNVSRQDIDWTSPGIMDIVISDLAGYYAQVTEAALGSALVGSASAGTDLPGTATGSDVAGAIWGAAGSVYAATKGQGRLIMAAPPDMLGLIGPLPLPIGTALLIISPLFGSPVWRLAATAGIRPVRGPSRISDPRRRGNPSPR
jgi:HK97 family phage major capsid protein